MMNMIHISIQFNSIQLYFIYFIWDCDYHNSIIIMKVSINIVIISISIDII